MLVKDSVDAGLLAPREQLPYEPFVLYHRPIILTNYMVCLCLPHGTTMSMFLARLVWCIYVSISSYPQFPNPFFVFFRRFFGIIHLGDLQSSLQLLELPPHAVNTHRPIMGGLPVHWAHTINASERRRRGNSSRMV
jgi:hypothetical protein